jgi:hypothetical protein
MKPFFLTTLKCMLVCSSFAQQLPTIMPPSPSAAAFARYGEIPVDHSTGVPSIEIPIYSIKSGKVKLPITLSYHASGIKVSDVASTAGLGWVLNAGGMISRTVYGQQDELATSPPPLKSSAAITQYIADNGIGANYQLNQLYGGVWDTQSDRYTYNVAGRVGVFRADFETGHLNHIPFSPTIISRKKDTPSDQVPYYEIVPEDGTRFIFKDTETSGRWMAPGSNRAWLLSKIISADSIEEINLYYRADEPFMERLPQTTYSKGLHLYHTDEIDPLTGACVLSSLKSDVVQSFDRSPIATIHAPKLLDSITSRNEVVKFSYSADRQDIRKNRLINIKVIDRHTRTLIKEFELEHSYFGNTTYSKRLRLDRVVVKHPDATQNPEQFTFSYNPIPLPEYFNPDKAAQGQFEFFEDYWGYYNGTTNGSMVPQQYLDPADRAFFGGNRESDSTHMKAASLEQITYPSGGKTVFKMEANRDGNEGIIGGLRVRKIMNLDSDGRILQTKTYSYNPGSFHSFGSELFKATDAYTYYGLVCLDPDGWSSNGWTENSSTDTWTGSALFSATVGAGSSVLYQTVTEYNGDEVNNTGRTLFFYENQDFFTFENFPISHPLFWDIHNFDHANYSPRLLMQIEQRNANGQYSDVLNTQHTYSKVKKYQFSTGFKIGRSVNYVNETPTLQDIPFGTNIFFLNHKSRFLNTFGYADTKAYKEVALLTRTRVAEGDMVTVTDFEYDTLTHLQIKKKTFQNSRQETLTTEYKYPPDLVSEAPVYQKMVNKNILTPVIEVSEYNNSNRTRLLKTNYKEWFPNILAPYAVDVKIRTYPVESAMVFHDYDSYGNILSVSKANDHRISYLWDSSLSYPIAQVTGSNTGQYFHTSFENPGEGNSTEFKTGSKSKTGGFSKSLSGLENGAYTLTYWSKSPGWQLVLQEVVVSNGAYTISLTGHVDEVRFARKGAQFNTLTYKPGGIVTSKTDVNNISTYFDYDEVNRLRSIKDHEGSIMKTFEYHFKK